MQALLILAVTFGLMWVLFLLPQQRRVKAHQALVATLQEGDDVVLTAGIYGRITDLGPEDMLVEVAPSVEIRVARMAVLRLVEDTTSPTSDLADQPDTAIPDQPDPSTPVDGQPVTEPASSQRREED
jgi:preprotein translocase subunit YajC